MISLVDTDRIWFKSRFGIDIAQIDRDLGLCSLAIQSDDIYLMEDAIKDSQTATTLMYPANADYGFMRLHHLK